MDTKLTKEWSEYDLREGYEKKMQDIRLVNGAEVKCCWPNAGKFIVTGEPLNSIYHNKEIEEKLVTHVRLTHHHDWY